MKLRQFSKMTDSMKFGPEWLRNLDGNPAPSPRYELADFRYGKEEMLALFDPSVKPPDSLLALPSLLIEKTQTPLTLAPMTEDETRMWNRTVNSEAVLRLTGKAPPGNISSGGGSLVAGPGGRGGGRGSLRGARGGPAGGGIPFHYSRTSSYDESAGDGTSCPDGPPPFQRNMRSFDRSQMDRGWNERNGAETNDWNGSTSPRKEYGQRSSVGGGVGGNPNSGGLPGGSSFDNWRRPHRGGGEEEEGWRTSRMEKWSRYTSWRDGEKETSYEKDSSFKYRNINDGRENNRRSWDDGSRGHHHMGSGPGGGGGNHRAQFNHDDDTLPEWATEHADGGGSFDASGAFHHITGIGGPGNSNTIGGGGGGGGGYTDDECDESLAATSRKKRQPSESELIRGNRPKGSIQINSRSEDTPPPPPAPTIHDSSRSSAKINIEALQTSKSMPSISTSTTSVTSTKKSQEGSPNSLSIATSSSPPLTTSSSNTNIISTSPASKYKPNHSSSETNPEPLRSNQDEQLESSTLSSESNVSTTMPLQSTGSTHKTTMIHDHRHMTTRQTSTDDQLEHMNEAAVDLVSKLIEEPHQQPPPPPPPPIAQHQQQYHVAQGAPVSVPPSQNDPYGVDKWYYRDPQGEVQGPFTSVEMNEWFRAGYFGLNLLVKRVCDERYSQLGELAKICGQVPFLPGFTLPPITGPDLKLVTETQAPPPAKMPLNHDLLQHYQIQQQLLQRQLLLGGGTLNAQPNLIQSRPTANLQPPPSQPPSAPPNYLPTPHKHNNPLMDLINQLQQQQQHQHQAQTSGTNSTQPETKTQNIQKLEPIQQLIQQMGGLQGNPAVIQPQPQAPTNIPITNINDPNKIQNMLSQIALQHKTQQDLWLSQEQQVAAAALAAGFPGWLGVTPTGQHAPQPAPPPPTSLWGDIEPVLPREIKTTESHILEQQLIRKPELGHQEEEENCLPMKDPIDEMKERMRLLEEERKKEEEKRRILADQLIQEEEKMKRKEEEKRKAEEQRKAEEAARKREEAARKKEEEKELKRKAEEEAKRKAAEEEAAAMAKQKMEEEAARQQRRQAEALRRLQEQQQRQSRPAPWGQPSSSVSTIVAPPVADIQRQEREKKEREMQQQMLANIQMQQQQETLLSTSILAQGTSNGAGANSFVNKPSLQLKWADKKQVSTPRVKSLAEIQQEEAENERKERERTERAQQQAKEAATSSAGLANAGIWGLASQSLSWATTTAVNSQSTSQPSAWGTSTRQQKSLSGFWDETPAPTPPTKNQNKASNKAPSVSENSVNTGTSEKTLNNKNTSNDSSKNTKDQALVLKLFEQHTSVDDEFSEWCTKTLTTFNAHVDIPTFVVFLRDIESPYEVKDYVREFLGEGREASEFANHFLERRSTLRRAAKAHTSNRPNKPDDLNVPAQALNPNGGSGLAPDFHEVKGKTKKSKKNKMIKVDHRILGFNVTASQDRINVGDRDYVEM